MYGYGDDSGRGGGGGGNGYGAGGNGSNNGYGSRTPGGGGGGGGYGSPGRAGGNQQPSPYGHPQTVRMPDAASPAPFPPVYPRIPPPRSGPVQRAYGAASPQETSNPGYGMSPPSNYNSPRPPPPSNQYASPPSQYNTPRPPPQGQYAQQQQSSSPYNNNGNGSGGNTGRSPPQRTPQAPYGTPPDNGYPNGNGRTGRTPPDSNFSSPQPWDPTRGGARPGGNVNDYDFQGHEMKQLDRNGMNQMSPARNGMSPDQSRMNANMSPGKIMPNQHMAPPQGMGISMVTPSQGRPTPQMSNNVPPPQAPKDPQWFFGEINRIGRDIDNAQQLLLRLETLKRDVFSSLDQSAIARSINQLSDDAKATFQSIIADLSRLKATPGAAGAPAAQITTKQEKLRKLQESYKFKERELEHAARDQMRGQMRIARPDLDDEAIAEAVPDAQPQQIFANATMQSARKGQATATLGAVKARSEALAKIVQDFEQCTELFLEMEQQVLKQGEMVEHVEEQAEEAKVDVEVGVQHLDKGVAKAKSARKKKWCCLGISVAIVVAVVVAILVWKFVFQNQGASKRRRSLAARAARADTGSTRIHAHLYGDFSAPAPPLPPPVHRRSMAGSEGVGGVMGYVEEVIRGMEKA